MTRIEENKNICYPISEISVISGKFFLAERPAAAGFDVECSQRMA